MLIGQIMWIIFGLVVLCHFALSSAQCPRRLGPGCKGPYVIRPARQQRKSHQCHADQQSTMTLCMQQCQADVCCRAFGLDAAGECVTSNVTTETLHFVKETPDPVQASCLTGFCNECEKRGKCSEQDNQPICLCDDGFVGVNCETDFCSLCQGPGGKCVREDGVPPKCDCIAGFNGTYCENDTGHVRVKELSVEIQDGLDVGEWGEWDTCPTGSYAAGIRLRIQQYDGATTDDTGANAIYIYCKSAISLEVTGNISSATMSFGDLEDTKFCAENYWIVDYTLVAEPAHFGDNTGTGGLWVKCRGHGMDGVGTQELQQTVKFTRSKWAPRAGECPSGTAVCSLRTRVQPYQGALYDDSSLIDAKMYCCDY